MVAVSAIRRIEVVGTSSGLDETRTKLEAVARAQTTVAQTAEGMAVTTEQSARRQLSAASNYDRLRRSIDETFRTEQRYAQGQSIIERAFEQGHIQAAEYARSLQLLADKHGVVSLAAARQTAELQRAAEMQARINAMTGVTGGSDTAARGADIEAYGQALSRLQAKYDPVFAASERYKASLVEIDQAQRVGAISIEVATQARLKAIASYNGEISALERVGAARKAAAQAMVDRQTVTPDRGADIAAYGKQLDDLRAKYSPLYAAGRQYKETLAEINAAAKVGAITEAERAAAVMDTKAAFVQQTNTLRGVRDAQDITSAASGKLAVGVGLARHELINLGRQAQDVIVSLQGGQGLGTVMLQQGSQIADVFVASKASIGDFATQSVNWLGRFLTVGRLAFGGVALSITGAALALNSYLDSQQRVQMSLLGSGRASGQTAGSINAIGQSSSSLTGFSVREAREFAAELASTGKIGRDNLEPIVKIGHDIATVFGIDASEAAKLLGKAYADPARGAEELNARLGFLDASMQRQIQNLTAQGRVWDAQRVLQAGVASSLVGVNETLSTSTKFWTALGNVASNVWDRIGAAASRATGIGLKLGLDDQLAQAQARLQELEKIAERRSAAVNKGLGTTNQIEQQRAEIDKITEAMNRNAAATQAAQDRQRSFAQAQAVQQQLPDITQVERLRNENELLVRTMIDVQTSGGAASPILKAMGVTYEQLAQAVQNSTSKVRNFKTEFEQATQAQQLQMQSLTAFSPGAKGDVAYQQRLNAERARETEETKAQALAEGDRALAIKGVGVAQSEAARARELYARQSVAAVQLEIDMVGKSIGQQAEMRANLQARQALEQQASQNRTAFDEAEFARLQKINAELGKRSQELAKKQVNDQIDFDRKTIGLSQEDVQIAQQLRGIYPDVATALSSAEAEAMRLNSQLRLANDLGKAFGQDLVSGLLRGENAMKSLASAATNLIAKLSSAQLDRFMNGQGFGTGSLMSGAGALGVAGAGLAGYQSGNMLTGALGGALAGASFGPVGALVGGAVGFLGGLFGGDSKKKEEEEAARKAALAAEEAGRQRIAQLNARAQLAMIDTSTRMGAVAALEVQFQSQRLAEAQAGGQAMAALLDAQSADMAALQKSWDEKEIEEAKAKQAAIDQRMQSASDRLFAALNDNSTLEGQLAALDRQSARERYEEMKAGGEALNDLVAAQEAERANVIKKYNEELLKFVQGIAKSIRDYLQGLKTGANSILSPQDQLAAAQADFNAKLALAQGGDRDALSGITQVAQTLLDQAKSFYASSAGYTNIYASVTAALGNLANIGTGTVGEADKIVQAIIESKTATTGTITNTSLQEQSLLGAMNLVLGSINGVLEEVKDLNSTSTAQLNLLNQQYSGRPLTTPNGAGGTMTINNLMIEALNKIVYNTGATVMNTSGGSVKFGAVFAGGGLVTGPGTGTSDSIRANLSNREYVIQNAAVERLGVSFLDEINSGRVPVSPVPMPMVGRNDNARSAGSDGAREVGMAINRQTEILTRDSRDLREDVSAMKQEIKALNSKFSLVLAAA